MRSRSIRFGLHCWASHRFCINSLLFVARFFCFLFFSFFVFLSNSYVGFLLSLWLSPIPYYVKLNIPVRVVAILCVEQNDERRKNGKKKNTRREQDCVVVLVVWQRRRQQRAKFIIQFTWQSVSDQPKYKRLFGAYYCVIYI